MSFRHRDPLDDFAELDRKQAEYEARLPKCDKCKQRIHDEDYYEIDEEILCESCMKDKYKKSTEDYANGYE